MALLPRRSHGVVIVEEDGVPLGLVSASFVKYGVNILLLLIGALTADAATPGAFDDIDEGFLSAVGALAAAELPDYDVTVRGAVSIGRHLAAYAAARARLARAISSGDHGHASEHHGSLPRYLLLPGSHCRQPVHLRCVPDQ